jgi:hypothetical protein
MSRIEFPYFYCIVIAKYPRIWKPLQECSEHPMLGLSKKGPIEILCFMIERWIEVEQKLALEMFSKRIRNGSLPIIWENSDLVLESGYVFNSRNNC